MFTAARDLADAAGGFTDAGRETSERIETLTAELATPAHDVLTADELDELITGLKPITAPAQAIDDRARPARAGHTLSPATKISRDRATPASNHPRGSPTNAGPVATD
jgi:hypothetical protein